MNEHRPQSDDELLSAYFDGEVTPAERARVELLRNTSPDVAAKLASYAELSRTLKSVPRENAPPEVRAAALRVAERSSLLATPLPKASRPRRYIRDAGLIVTGMLVAGIAVMVFPSLAPHQPAGWGFATMSQSTPVARTMDFTDSTVPAGVSNTDGSGVDDHRFAIRSAMSDSGTNVDRDDDGLRPLAERTKNYTGNSFRAPTVAGFQREAGAGGVAAASPPAEGLTAFGVAAADDKTRFGDDNASASLGDRVPIAEVFPYLKANDDNNNISVVEIYVNNPEQSANRLQSSLVQNGVQTDLRVEAKEARSAKLTEKLAPGKTVSDQPATQELEQLAVYVDAPTEPVILSLEEMSQRRELLGVRLRPPLELPLDLSDRISNEPTTNRSRQLDVEQLKEIFNEYQAEYDAYAIAEPWSDAGQPVDALEALSRESKKGVTPSQRAANSRYANRGNFNRSMDRSFQVADPVQNTAPVPPIAGVQMESQAQLGINRLMKLPTSNTASRGTENYFYNQEATRAAAPQTAPQALADEVKPRRRLDNTYSLDNVRVLILLQESAATGKPTAASEPLAAPAAPAPADKK